MSTKLIKTTDHLLLIDEEAEVCRGQYRLLNDEVEQIHEGHNYPYRGFKIIAYRKLNEEAKELDLPELPPFEEVDINKIADKWFLINNYNKEDLIHSHTIPNCITNKNLFIAGYKAAQSKQFSLEEMKKAIEMSRTGYGYDGNIDIVAHLDMGGIDNYSNEFKFKSEEEIIQSLSTQQLPSEFIPEYEIVPDQNNYGSGEIFSTNMKEVLKTITNSEGKEVLVGTYKY